MLKIRRPLGRLIFNMGIAIPGKTVFLIETAPWLSANIVACSFRRYMLLHYVAVAKCSLIMWPSHGVTKSCCCRQCYLIMNNPTLSLRIVFFSRCIYISEIEPNGRNFDTIHYNEVIMNAMASQITGVSGEFPAQKASNAENVASSCTGVFLKDSSPILVQLAPKFVPVGPIDNMSISVLVMTWRRTGDKSLDNQCLIRG